MSRLRNAVFATSRASTNSNIARRVAFAGGRAANVFNLVNEGDGWKVMNIVWDNEREGVSLHDTGLS